MKNTLEKYLPIGTVCLLKGAKKRVMIVGFCGYSDDDTNKDKIYDYIGCMYPEGFISSKLNLMFNHDQVERIYSLGYYDEEEEQFKVNLKKDVISSLNVNRRVANVETEVIENI